MSELNIQEDPELYKIEPEDLIFKLDTDNLSELSSNTSKISKQIEIKVINGVNEYLCLKIKTAKRMNYIISQPNCIITPKEEKLIKVRFKRDEGEELKLKSYKLQLEGFIIKQEEKDANPKTLFEKYKKSKIKVIGKVMQVRSHFLDKYDNTLSLSSINSSEIKHNEKSIFVSALSQDLNSNYVNNNNQNKDKEEENIKKIIEDIKEENLDKNKIEETTVININNNEISTNNIFNNEDENKDSDNNDDIPMKKIKNEKIDLLEKLTKKQIIIGIIIIALFISLLIYFTI